MLRPSFLLLAVLPVVSCFPETEKALAPLCPTASVQVSSSGGPPVFNWPACGVSSLDVSAANNRSDIKWAFATPDQQPTIAPPVTYGQLPTGVTQTTPPAPLVAGTEYRMNLVVFVDGAPSTIASVRFTQP